MRLIVFRALHHFAAMLAFRQQRALAALRTSGDADLSPVVDQPVRELNPLRRRQQLLQILLDLDRIGLLRQPQQPRDAFHMRINDDPARDSKGSPQHHVRRLATHTRQLDQLIEAVRLLTG